MNRGKTSGVFAPVPTSLLEKLFATTFVLIVAEQIWSFLTLNGYANIPWFESLVHTLPLGLCSYMVWEYSKLHPENIQRPWRLLSLSLLSWTAGQVVYFYYLFVVGKPPFPSLADLFYLLAPLIMARGFLGLHKANRPKAEGMKEFLDALVVVLAAFAMLWYFILGKAVLHHIEKGQMDWPVFLATAYPLFDLSIMAILFTVVARWDPQGVQERGVRWLMLGLAAWTIADGYFLARQFLDNTLPEAHPYEVGWGWGALLFVWAARRSYQRSQKYIPSKDFVPSTLYKIGPYIAAAATFPLAVISQNADQLFRVGVEAAAALTLLVVLSRQFFLTQSLETTNTHLSNLSQDLERRVVERTKELEHQALHDDLTDLPNRYLAERVLNNAIIQHGVNKKSFGVLCIDLDRFKDINDTLGHLLGDEALLEVTKRFSETTPKNGFISRLGGDEFLVVLENLEPEQAKEKASEIAQAYHQVLEAPIHVRESEFLLDSSIGISIFPQDGLLPTDLVKRADNAMYFAKLEKSGILFHTAKLEEKVLLRLETERALRRSLNSDPSNTFSLYYQPIVDSEKSEIVGLEALVRWSDNGQIKLPAEFIPLAEETGLIVPLGNWVMEEACRQIVEWKISLGKTIDVCVNVSMAQFERPDFVETVKTILDKTGMDPTQLNIELLESVLARQVDQTSEKIQMLRSMGIKLSLDDFGSGFSSLSYLNKMVFDRIKIDRSFTQQLGTSRDTRPLVSAIFNIAHEFGMETVAEGVETQEQLWRLQKLGACKVQGWLFAKALEASEIPELMNRKNLAKIN